MGISSYSKFHHILSLLASNHINVEKSGNTLFCRNERESEQTQPGRAEADAIISYLVANRQHVRSSDKCKLEALGNRIKALGDADGRMDEIIDGILHDRPISAEPFENIPLIVEIQSKAPTNADELSGNLQLIINDPHLTLTEDLAVIEAYNSQLPQGWNRESVFQALSAKLNEFKDSQAISEMLRIVREQYRNIQITSLGISIVNSVDEDNGPILYSTVALVQQGFPVVATKALLLTHSRVIESLIQATGYQVYVQEPGGLALLIPPHTSPQDFGMALELKWTKKIVDMSLSFTDPIDDFSRIFLDDTETTIYRRLFAVHGHGLSDPAYVCGLTSSKFQQFLEVMNMKGAGMGIVTSCYAGGASSQSYRIPEGGLPFPLIVRGAIESTARGTKYNSYNHLIDATYTNIPAALLRSKMFLFPANSSGRTHPKHKQLTLNQLKDIAKHGLTPHVNSAILELSTFHTLFLPTNISDIPRIAHYFATGENVLEADAALQQSSTGIVAISHPYILFSKPIFKGVLKQELNESTALVSTGGRSQHFIKELEVPYLDLQYLICHSLGALDPSARGFPEHVLGAKKLFFIGKLTCKYNNQTTVLQNVVFSNRRDSAVLLFKNGDQYSEIKFFFVDNHFKADEQISIITPEDYVNALYWELVCSKSQDSHLRQTTAGKVGAADIYREIRKAIWEDSVPENAGFYEKILLNDRRLNGNVPENALALAAAADSLDSIWELLKNGRDINWSDKNGRTPLMYAAEAGNTKAVALLIKLGADINRQDHLGQTAFHRAVCSGEFECAQELLKNNIDISIRDTFGLTGSEWPKLSDHPQMARRRSPNEPGRDQLQLEGKTNLTIAEESLASEFGKLQEPEICKWMVGAIKNKPHLAGFIKTLVSQERFLLYKQIPQDMLIHYFPEILHANPNTLENALSYLIGQGREETYLVFLHHGLIKEKDWDKLANEALRRNFIQFLKAAMENGRKLPVDSAIAKKNFIEALAKDNKDQIALYQTWEVSLSPKDLKNNLPTFREALLAADGVEGIKNLQLVNLTLEKSDQNYFFLKAIEKGAVHVVNHFWEAGCRLTISNYTQPIIDNLFASGPLAYPMILLLMEKGAPLKIPEVSYPLAEFLLKNNIDINWERSEESQKQHFMAIISGQLTQYDQLFKAGYLPQPDSPLFDFAIFKLIDAQDWDKVERLLIYRKQCGADINQDKELFNRCFPLMEKHNINLLKKYLTYDLTDRFYTEKIEKDYSNLQAMLKWMDLGAKLADSPEAQALLFKAFESRNIDLHTKLIKQGIRFDPQQVNEKIQLYLDTQSYDLLANLIRAFPVWKPTREQRSIILAFAINSGNVWLLHWAKSKGASLADIEITFNEIKSLIAAESALYLEALFALGLAIEDPTSLKDILATKLQNRKNDGFVLLLIKKGVEPDWKDPNLKHLVNLMVFHADLEWIEIFIKKGVQVDVQTNEVKDGILDFGNEKLLDLAFRHRILPQNDEDLEKWIYLALKRGHLVIAKKLKDILEHAQIGGNEAIPS